MHTYSRPMADFVALKFGILIAKRLFNGKSMPTNPAFMPVANKVGHKAYFRNVSGKTQQIIIKQEW